MTALVAFRERRIGLEISARQIVEKDVECCVEQVPPAARQIIKHRLLVRQQKVVAGVKFVALGKTKILPQKVGQRTLGAVSYTHLDVYKRQAQMRASDPPVQYLVGTPKGRLSKLEQALTGIAWQKARERVAVKLLPQDGELYVFAESRDRVAKERAMRRRQLRWLCKRLAQISAMKLTREELLMKLGSARSQAPTAWRLVDIEVDRKRASLTYRLNRKKLAQARRREGRYLLRTNLNDSDPAKLWELYLTLVKIEEAFKTLKSDLALRPIFHQREDRIEAHIFIAFLAYCLHVTLGRPPVPM